MNKPFNQANTGGSGQLCGQWNIGQAVKNWQCDHLEVNASQLTQAHLAQHLNAAGLPDVDLLIRNGGEQRISNFLLW